MFRAVTDFPHSSNNLLKYNTTPSPLSSLAPAAYMNDPGSSSTVESSCYDELKWHSAPPLDAPIDEEHPAASPRHSQQHQDDVCNVDDASSPSFCENNNTFLPLHAEKTALLVVDVQPEYWSQCPPVRQDFPEFPSKLQATVDICRQQTVAKIIWVRADYRYSHSPWLKQFARIHGLPARTTTTTTSSNNSNFRAEVPCDPTSKEFQWEDFATPAGGDVIIPKSSWSSTSNTALMDILRAANVDTVLVCGLITSVCVQHSAFGIFEAGYRTILVTDACADRGKARHEAALALYGDYMYELISSDDLRSSSSPRGLRKAKPLWALPMSRPSPVLSAQPPLCSLMTTTPTTLSASTSTSSLSSSSAGGTPSGNHADVITSIMPELHI